MVSAEVVDNAEIAWLQLEAESETVEELFCKHLPTAHCLEKLSRQRLESFPRKHACFTAKIELFVDESKCFGQHVHQIVFALALTYKHFNER